MSEPSTEGQWHFIFKSYADLARDVDTWCKHMPPISGVYGMPRSGLLLASMIALNLNIPLVGIKPYLTREVVVQPSASRPILVVDDSCCTGDSFHKMKEMEQPDMPLMYGCYLCNPQFSNLWDMVFLETGNCNQLMEWSTLHIPFNKYTLSDLDGVLCEDWCGPETIGADQETYKDHLLHAKCLRRPTYPLLGIVTARLEKYRAETQVWLASEGIKYEKLYMAPFATAEEREKGDGFAGHKARVYGSLPDAHLFVESDPHQSEAITFRTGKPVLDWGSKRLLHYGVRLQVDRCPLPSERTTLNKAIQSTKPLEALVPLLA